MEVLRLLVGKYVKNLQLAKNNWKKSTSCVVSMEPQILVVGSRLKLSTSTNLHGISLMVGLRKFWLCARFCVKDVLCINSCTVMSTCILSVLDYA